MIESDRQPFRTKALNWLLRGFFQLLYNQFAWTYDWIARFVSLGLWNDWILTVIPFLHGDPILEIGHGTGHLQLALSKKQRAVYGLDLSSSMGRIASKRLRKADEQPILIRGKASSIPFSNECFTSIVATFPSEHIANQQTIEEIWRVLQENGRLVILPYAWIVGDRWLERLARTLFRITDQAPEISTIRETPIDAFGEWIEALVRTAQQLGFHVLFEEVLLRSSRVMVIVAEKAIFSRNK